MLLMLQPLRYAGCRLAPRRSIGAASTRRYIATSERVFTVAQLLKQGASSDSDVTLNGFVRTIRKQKRVAFAAIGDGTSLEAVQAVLTPEQAGKLSTGAALRITGQWQPSPSGKEQSHELQATDVQSLGENDAEV
jgi:aspartyl/asparaginyl-tRNA synthetase